MKSSRQRQEEAERDDAEETSSTTASSAGVVKRSGRESINLQRPASLQQQSKSKKGMFSARDASYNPTPRSPGPRDNQEAPEQQGFQVISESERLAKIRDSTNAKVLRQQWARRSHSSASIESGSVRVSPIREEGSVKSSPSVEKAREIGGAGPRTDSSASTASPGSSKTVRASRPPTPDHEMPLRTPSYPFPYVPTTQRTWSSSFHQPFTTLSPTVGSLPTRTKQPLERANSGLTSGKCIFC